MKEELLSLAGQLLVVLAPILVILFSKLGKKLGALIDGSVDNKLVSSGLVRLNDAAFTVAQELMQTMVSEFRKASEDGKLTEEEKSLLKNIALNKMKNYMSLDELSRIFGLSSKNAEKLMESKIEAAVGEVKKRDELLGNG